MMDIEYLERKKIEIVADHVRRCHDTNLSEAEKIVLAELNWKIERMKKMEEGELNEPN